MSSNIDINNLQPGDEVVVTKLSGSETTLYLEDGPYMPVKDGERQSPWATASDDDGEIVVIEYNIKLEQWFESI